MSDRHTLLAIGNLVVVAWLCRAAYRGARWFVRRLDDMVHHARIARGR